MNQIQIGKFIAKCRKEKKLTQKDLAEKLGITDKAISKWENGRCLPDISFLELLAKELDITINELIKGERIAPNELVKTSDENIKMALNDLELSNRKLHKLYSFIFNIIIIITIYFLYFGLKKIQTITIQFPYLLLYYLMFGIPITLFLINFHFSRKNKTISIITIFSEIVLLLPLIIIVSDSSRMLYCIVLSLIMLLGQFLGFLLYDKSVIKNSLENKKLKKQIRREFLILIITFLFLCLIVLMMLITNKTFFKNSYIGITGQEIFVPKYSYFEKECCMYSATFYSLKSKQHIIKEVNNYLKTFDYNPSIGYQKGNIIISQYRIEDYNWYRKIIIQY